VKNKYHVWAFALAVAGLGIAAPVKALEKIEITEDIAQGTVPEISVPGGHSVLLNFENDRYIQSVLIDDPRILGVATDRALCIGQSTGGGCGFASAMRLTQISGGLDLPGVSFSQGNGLATVVSVMTTDRSGDDSEVYQFLVNTTGSSSDVSMISIVPSSQQPVETEVSSSLGRNTTRSSFDISQIKAGRQSAIDQGLADTDSDSWLALEEFIGLVEEGESVANAIAKTEVPVALLTELERMGSISAT
jgi:hypothetical protein